MNAYKFYFTKTMFYVSEMNWLESRNNEVIKSSNMISDENGRCFCIKEAFKAVLYLFTGKSGSRVKMLTWRNKQKLPSDFDKLWLMLF